MPNFQPRIRKLLNAIRKRHNLSCDSQAQKWIAEYAKTHGHKLSARTVEQWSQGRRKPRYDSVRLVEEIEKEMHL